MSFQINVDVDADGNATVDTVSIKSQFDNKLLKQGRYSIGGHLPSNEHDDWGYSLAATLYAGENNNQILANVGSTGYTKLFNNVSPPAPAASEPKAPVGEG